MSETFFLTNDDWLMALTGDEPSNRSLKDAAHRELHALLLKASRFKISQLTDASRLGASRLDELAHTATNDALIAVLAKVAEFEGRSKFTTWVYKFGIFHASNVLRKHVWRHREVDLEAIAESATVDATPAEHLEQQELKEVMLKAMKESLSARQREVLLAVTVEGVPIDVVAERLESNRNAVYKTLHDARRKLRENPALKQLLPSGF